MSNSRLQSALRMPERSLEKFAKSFTPDQPSLFSLQPTPMPGSLNDDSLVRAIVTEGIRNSTKSREQIADEMTLLLADKVTIRMLNSYTSEAAEQHRWPAQYTRAFCYVIQDWSLLRCIAERAGFRLITAEEAELLELGRQFLMRKRADEEIALIEGRLHGRAL
jgi:hypothetical protein